MNRSMRHTFQRSSVAIALLVMLAACGEPNMVMQAEFTSMQECLNFIRSSTGLELDPMTDKPDKVTGFLRSTRQNFACSQGSSGTKGTYVEG